MGAADDIEELARQGRFPEAAARAAAAGDAARASQLYERACDFPQAAAEALRSGDARRALALAATGDDEPTGRAALEALAANPAELARAALHLESRGAFLWASRVREALGERRRAAENAERAGDVQRAAALFEAEGDVRRAAAALETALTRDGERHDLRLALGELLVRHGRLEAASRVVQRIPAQVAHRPAAARLLATAFEGLGLTHAAEEARREAGVGASTATIPPASPPRAIVRPRLFGRYDVLGDVATSPWARVVRGVDLLRGTAVALKIFAGQDVVGAGRDAWARFAREAEILTRLRHPHVVAILDVVPEGPAIAMPWMDGGTLERILAGPPLQASRAAEIAAALLDALTAAHRVGILHRDVKPANVLFDEAGAPHLADFGVAHLDDVSTTATAAVLGTRAYMSPEQREGRPATVASDVYSVGAVLYELLTGLRPGPDGTMPAPPSQVHPHLDERHDALFRRLLAAEGSARPESAEAAREALRSVPWPVARRARTAGLSSAPPAAPLPERLVHEAPGPVDAWMARPIVRVPAAPGVLARARAFARAGHPALQTVLRLEEGEAAVWLETVPGERPSGPLTKGQIDDLGEALALLHREGTAHGHVDREHVRIGDEGEVTLLFPTTAVAEPSAEADLRALEALRGVAADEQDAARPLRA